MTRKQKHLLARIVIAAILFFAGSLFYLPEYMEAGIFLICYIVVGSLTNSAISHQLHALRITKLVRSRKARKRVFYSLQDEHIQWILEETYAHISER